MREGSGGREGEGREREGREEREREGKGGLVCYCLSLSSLFSLTSYNPSWPVQSNVSVRETVAILMKYVDNL